MEYKTTPEDELMFSRVFDAIEGTVGNVWEGVQEASQEGSWLDRSTIIGDDVLRLMGGGLMNTAQAISAIPGVTKLAEFEEWLVERARATNEELTPWLDPRVAGWGTRIASGWLLDKGVGKVLKGAKYAGKAGVKRILDNIPADKVYALSSEPIDSALNVDRLKRVKDLARKLNIEADKAVNQEVLDTALESVNKDIPLRQRMNLRTAARYEITGFDATGEFDIKKFREVMKDMPSEGREFLGEFETGTALSGASKGDFRTFKAFKRSEMPAIREAFSRISEGLTGLPMGTQFEVHHIAALKATANIYDGLQWNSPIYRQVTDRLLKHVPGLGQMEGNLMGVVGKSSHVGTPHYLVHKFYSDLIGKSGQRMFTDTVLKNMRRSKSYRLKKADELGRIIAKSEEIVRQAQEVFESLYSTAPVSFDDLITRMGKLNDFGYNDLIDPKYQVKIIPEIIEEAVADLKKNPYPKFKSTKSVSKSEFSKMMKALTVDADWPNMGMADRMRHMATYTGMTYDQIDELIRAGWLSPEQLQDLF